MADTRHTMPIDEIEPFGGRILSAVIKRLKEPNADPLDAVAYALGSIADTMWLSYLLERRKAEGK